MTFVYKRLETGKQKMFACEKNKTGWFAGNKNALFAILRKAKYSLFLLIGKAQANVVVAVVRSVVVTVRRTAVLRVVVPTATANNTVIAFRQTNHWKGTKSIYGYSNDRVFFICSQS